MHIYAFRFDQMFLVNIVYCHDYCHVFFFLSKIHPRVHCCAFIFPRIEGERPPPSRACVYCYQTCCLKRCNLTSVSLRIMGPLVSRCGRCPVHSGVLIRTNAYAETETSASIKTA